jgi:RND superfamily putative drug exporter
MFEALGRFVYRRRWLILALASAFLAASLAMLVRGGALTSATIRGLEAGNAGDLVAEVLGHPADNSFVVVMRVEQLDAGPDQDRAAVRRALEPLRTDPRVLAVVGPEDVPPPLDHAMLNASARSAIAVVTLAGDAKAALAAYPAVRARLGSEGVAVACTGRIPFLSDMNRTLERDLERAELISLPVALLILLLVFRTAVAALLPVGVGGLAVAGGLAIVLGISRHLEIAQYAVNVCSLLGLGLSIDYSLFTVSRYREELAAGHDYPTALSRAVGKAGRVVASSGIAVCVGLTGLLFFDGSYLMSIGVGGAIVVALAVLFALTFLPALLAVLGPRIHAGRLPFSGVVRPGGGPWHRVASWVMRRPVAVLVPTLAALLLLGVPFLHVRLAASDVHVLSADVEARRGYELLVRDFPDQAMTRVTVAVRFPGAPALTEGRVGALYDLSRRMAAIPHVRRVESVVDGDPALRRADYQHLLLLPPGQSVSRVLEARRMSVGDHVVLLEAITDRAPESEEARAVVRAIREDRQVADGALLVGGQTAEDLDATAFILKRAPRAIAFVVAVTLVVLFLFLGSVVLPLKAIAMNFVSLTGSFGALVWIFQDGHLFVREPRPLDPSVPPLLFCVLFGLSMDYEILMLSRIKESYLSSGDNTLAVAEGLEKTAGIITSAAGIMVAVFISFSFAHVVVIQAVGVGMALAVAIDATLVRVLLVPSTMRLLGHLNWWAPRVLVRLRQRIVDRGPSAPAARGSAARASSSTTG